MTYDLIVIGGGPAGYLAAERAAQAGMKVILFEKRNLGGVCLNEGCIPTKTLLYSAKIFESALNGSKYGVHADGITIDHAAVVARKDKVVRMLVGGVKSTLTALRVEIIAAEARVLGKEGDTFNVQASGQVYHSRNMLIATGSEPVLPPIYGLKEALASGFALTNREVLAQKSLPNAIAIIGGGVIGLEFASYYRSVGCSVTVIEMLDHIAGAVDREISDILYRNYMKKGIDFRLGGKVTEIRDGGVTYQKSGNDIDVFCDQVLVSIGRRPVARDLGLETIGVEMDGSAIRTDHQCRTNVPGVYAAGDVNGRSMLAHTAYREAEVAVAVMLGQEDTVDYDTIPAVIYTNPEVGSVGETEESAREKGYDCSVRKLSMRYSGRYIAENEGGDGICKLIVDNAPQTLLGVHLIANYASEAIYGASLMVGQKLTMKELQKTVFPHPTIGEAIREALFMHEPV